MPATVKEVAKLAGVSTATVSRVINRNDLVNNETRNRVLSSIEVLGYVQNRNAVELSRSKRLKPQLLRSTSRTIELQKTDTATVRKSRELMTEKLHLLAIKCDTLGTLIKEVIQDVKCIT